MERESLLNGASAVSGTDHQSDSSLASNKYVPVFRHVAIRLRGAWRRSHVATLLQQQQNALLKVDENKDLVGEQHDPRRDTGGDHSRQEANEKRIVVRFAMLLLLLVLLGAANGVLYKMVLIMFGQNYAFFVDQGNNFNYIIVSGIALSFRVWKQRRASNSASVPSSIADISERSKLLVSSGGASSVNQFQSETTEASGVRDGGHPPDYHRINTAMMRRVPQWKFVLMGLLDGLGTFFSAVGGVYTPGMMQTLLNQLLIPFTMIVSLLVLRARFSAGEVVGAFIIFAGAVLTVGPSAFSDTDPSIFRWTSVLIYTASNIPMAFSAIWKQWGFQKAGQDVFWLTFWVGIYQMFVSFLFVPALALKSFGGIPISTIPFNLWHGAHCWIGINSQAGDACTPWNSFLLTAYTTVNFAMNLCGLYLTKEGSAVLASMGYALKLPITNIAFSLCFILTRRFCEPFTVWLALGLVVVLIGFSIYSFALRKTRGEVVTGIDAERALSSIVTDGLEDEDSSEDEFRQDSFQERVVGMGLAVQ